VIEGKIREWTANGESVTRRMIQKLLKEQCGIEITLDRITHYLREWECEYGKGNEQKEEAKTGGVRASHCRGMVRHSREFMQKCIDEHPELLVGKLGEGELEVKGGFAVNSWGVAQYEEEDVESRLQSAEDWAVATTIDDMEDVSVTQSVEATQSADSKVDGQENVPPQPQTTALSRQLHPLFSSGMIRLTLNV
jgi:hypothetical protein